MFFQAKNKTNIILFNAVIVLLLMCVGFLIALRYTRTHKHTTTHVLYQSYLEPAVMVACNKGFGKMVEPQPQALQDFLLTKTQRFDCAQLPPKLHLNQELFLKHWYYLLYTVGITWKILGITWRAIDFISAIFFAITIGLAFFIFRLKMGIILSLIGAQIFANNNLHREMLLTFSDYVKTPFLLAGLLIIGVLVTQQLSQRVKFGLMILFGMVVGIGLGYRPDVIILLPPLLLTLLFFQPQPIISNILRNIAFFLIVILVLSVCVYPIFSQPNDPDIGSCLYHLPLMGLTQIYSNMLKIQPSVYGFSYFFSDQMIYSMVSGYAEHFLHNSHIVPCSVDFDFASKHLYQQIVLTFPADILARIYAAILQLFSMMHYGNQWFSWLTLVGTGILLLTLVIVNLRLAIFLTLAILYFGGLQTVVFQYRHYFYLFFWSWWPWGFFLAVICQAVFFERKKSLLEYFINVLKTQTKHCIKRVIIFITTLFIMLAVPLCLARVYQTHRVTEIIESYLHAKNHPIAYNIEQNKKDDTTVFKLKWPSDLALPTNLQTGEFFSRTKMLHIVIGGKQCVGDVMRFRLGYQAKGYYNFTTTFIIDLTTLKYGNYNVYSPAYFIAGDYAPRKILMYRVPLSGINMPVEIVTLPAFASCIQSISEIDTSDLYPMWFFLKLPGNWRELALYQKIIL